MGIERFRNAAGARTHRSSPDFRYADRSTPIACSALRRTTRPALGCIHTGYWRQGCDRFLRGAKAAVIGAMGGRVVVDVRRLARDEEALLERMGQIFPYRSVPRKRVAVGSSHMGHSAPARGDKRTQAAAARPYRIGRQADRLHARSRYLPDPFPLTILAPYRPGSTRPQAGQTGGCGRCRCRSRGGSRARASQGRMGCRL